MPFHRHELRVMFLGLLTGVVVTLLVVLLWPAHAAGTLGALEWYGAGMVQGTRLEAGADALRVDASLSGCAEIHSQRMAREGHIFHTGDACGARRENVGAGPSVVFIHSGFVDSRPHRANIICRCGRVGIGVAKGDDGFYYVTEVFA